MAKKTDLPQTSTEVISDIKSMADVAKQVVIDITDAEYVFDPADDPDIEYVEGMTLIPSGCKRLDIACSDTTKGAFALGKYANLIGDSSSGKTILALSMLAEMSKIPFFDTYDFVYDDVEQAMSFNLPKLFGKKLAARLQPPAVHKDGSAIHSDTIQDFNLYINNRIDSKKPFIYILDSFDALTSDAEIDTNDTMLKNMRSGKNEKVGSYGMDKPKIIGQILRQIVTKLNTSQSFLLIISQTRDNISVVSFAEKTRSGGRALKFYASHEIWLATAGPIKKTVLGQERVIGTKAKAKVTKNKLTGKSRSVEFDIYYEYGIDDIGSCIDFLITTKTIGSDKKSLCVPQFNFEGSKEKLVQLIEEKGLEEDMFKIYHNVWMDIENKLNPRRKSKFD